MDANDLAHRTAAALSAEFGAELLSQTDKVIRDGLQPAERTRDFQILTDTASIAVIAQFVILVAPMVLKYWSSTKSVEATANAVSDELRRPPGLDAQTAKRVVDSAVDLVQRNG